MEPRLLRDCCEGVMRSFYSGIEVAPRLLLVQFVDDSFIGGVSTFCLPSISHRVEVCYDILYLVFAGRVCVLVAVISVITITFHVCVFLLESSTWLFRLSRSYSLHMFVFRCVPCLHGFKGWRVLRTPIL